MALHLSWQLVYVFVNGVGQGAGQGKEEQSGSLMERGHRQNLGSLFETQAPKHETEAWETGTEGRRIRYDLDCSADRHT